MNRNNDDQSKNIQVVKGGTGNCILFYSYFLTSGNFNIYLLPMIQSFIVLSSLPTAYGEQFSVNNAWLQSYDIILLNRFDRQDKSFVATARVICEFAWALSTHSLVSLSYDQRVIGLVAIKSLRLFIWFLIRRPLQTMHRNDQPRCIEQDWIEPEISDEIYAQERKQEETN